MPFRTAALPRKCARSRRAEVTAGGKQQRSVLTVTLHTLALQVLLDSVKQPPERMIAAFNVLLALIMRDVLRKLLAMLERLIVETLLEFYGGRLTHVANDMIPFTLECR